MYNLQDRQVKENKAVHSSAISMLRWNPAGNRLVAGDEVGFSNFLFFSAPAKFPFPPADFENVTYDLFDADGLFKCLEVGS